MADKKLGFILRLRGASDEELGKYRRRCAASARLFLIAALVFFLGAVIAAIVDEPSGVSVALSIGVLQLVGVMSMQTKVWLVDLVASEKGAGKP